MKQIMLERPEISPVIYSDDVTENELYDNIVAYISSGGKSVVILTRHSKCPTNDRNFGFIYLHELLRGETQSSNRKYMGSSQKQCIEKVLKAGRYLYMFSDTSEFVKFVATHNYD